jgi:hypothetical protein
MDSGSDGSGGDEGVQIHLGIEAVELCGFENGVEVGRALAAGVGACEGTEQAGQFP